MKTENSIDGQPWFWWCPMIMRENCLLLLLQWGNFLHF